MSIESHEATPVVSLVIGGYTENLSYDAVDTFEGIRRQTFPLSQVELIFVGTPEQTERWQTKWHTLPFHAVKTVAVEGGTYMQEKQTGGDIASGGIIAFTDMDVSPHPDWLATIVQGIERGADVVGGVTFFHSKSGWGPSNPVMQMLASMGEGSRSFKVNNLAFRSEVYRCHAFRPDLERRGAGVAIYNEYIGAGLRTVCQRTQNVSHSFTCSSWIDTNLRYGFETIIIRRDDPWAPHRWVMKLSLLEPILTMLWRMALDVRQWFVFSGGMAMRLPWQILLLPVLFPLSVLGRSLELIGMYGALFAPARMRRFAATH